MSTTHNPSERTENCILDYCRRIQLGQGHRLLPMNVQEISLSLRADEKPLLMSAIKGLIAAGVFRNFHGDQGSELELTEKGYATLYSA